MTNTKQQTHSQPPVNPSYIAHLDERAELGMLNIATKAEYLGVNVVSIGAEGSTVYVGHAFRIESKQYGTCCCVLGGYNARWWGTDSGRAQMAWGYPKRDQWDAVAGVIVPWERVLSLMPVVSGWTPPRPIMTAAVNKVIADSGVAANLAAPAVTDAVVHVANKE